MLKVLLVSPLPPPYGGISHWTEMIKRYSESQDDISLQVLNIAPTWRDIHDLSIWKRVIGGGLQLIWNIIFFIKIVLKNRPDIVHLTTSGQLAVVRDIFILAICRILKIGTVYHIRFGRLPQILQTQTKEARFFCCAAKMAGHVVAIDQKTYEALVVEFYYSKVSLVPNCFDPSALPAVNHAPLHKVVFIGWVIPTKGIQELVEAWTLLDRSEWSLTIVGPGDDHYIDEVKKYGKENSRIAFVGPKNHSETMSLLNESTILVLPSYTEGFPNVVLEAMAACKAIVATNVGAIPEMLGKDRGILISPQDTLALSNALKTLMSDPVLCHKLAQAAYDYAQSCYSVQAVFSLYKNLWVAGVTK